MDREERKGGSTPDKNTKRKNIIISFGERRKAQSLSLTYRAAVEQGKKRSLKILLQRRCFEGIIALPFMSISRFEETAE